MALPFEFPPPSVRWQVSVNGGPFTDFAYIGTPLIFYSVTLDMSGNRYRAIFTNSAGSTTSDAATLTVVPAIPVVSWPNPADIPFGTALTSTQLNATGSVAGTFTYTPAAGTILPVRNGQTLTVTFTPTDSVN